MPDFSISEYDYKILNYIAKSKKSVYLTDIKNKFKNYSDLGVLTVNSLVGRGLIYWRQSTESESNNVCSLSLSDKGRLIHSNYTYKGLLENKERLKERIIGFISGTTLSALGFFAKEFLWPLIIQKLSS